MAEPRFARVCEGTRACSTRARIRHTHNQHTHRHARAHPRIHASTHAALRTHAVTHTCAATACTQCQRNLRKCKCTHGRKHAWMQARARMHRHCARVCVIVHSPSPAEYRPWALCMTHARSSCSGRTAVAAVPGAAAVAAAAGAVVAASAASVGAQ